MARFSLEMPGLYSVTTSSAQRLRSLHVVYQEILILAFYRVWIYNEFSMPVGIGSRWNADIGMQYAGRIGYRG